METDTANLTQAQYRFGGLWRSPDLPHAHCLETSKLFGQAKNYVGSEGFNLRSFWRTLGLAGNTVEGVLGRLPGLQFSFDHYALKYN